VAEEAEEEDLLRTTKTTTTMIQTMTGTFQTKRNPKRNKNGTADASVARKACVLCEVITKAPAREGPQESGTKIVDTIKKLLNFYL
jgi:hypothetical protein